MFDTLSAQPWQEKSGKAGAHLLLATRNWTLLDAALLTLDSGELHPTVAAEWHNSLRLLAAKLASRDGRTEVDADRIEAAQLIQRYWPDPASVKLRALPTVPPDAPI